MTATTTGSQVRLLTWNVQCSAAHRARQQADWLIRDETADILVLTEVAPGAGGRVLAERLTDAGLHVLAPEHHGDRHVLLATRTPHTPLAVPDPLVADTPAETPNSDSHDDADTADGASRWRHRFPAAGLAQGGQHITVGGLYVPSRGPQERHNQDKRAFQDAVSARLCPLAASGRETGVLVVAGDLNVVEPGHIPHHKEFGRWEYTFYDAFAAAGLTDAFRHLHPGHVDHSWFGRRSGLGYRFDHIFVADAHCGRVTDCRYLHQPRTDRLSDHAAMTVTLALS